MTDARKRQTCDIVLTLTPSEHGAIMESLGAGNLTDVKMIRIAVRTLYLRRSQNLVTEFAYHFLCNLSWGPYNYRG